MCIPMPQPSVHLSPTPPHWHPLLLPHNCSSPIPFFLLSLHDPCVSFDSFVLLFLHLCLFHWHYLCTSSPSCSSFIYTIPTSLSITTSKPAFPNYFVLRMDNFSAPFSSTTTNPSATTIATTASSNVNVVQQNMGYPQNAYFPDNGSLGFPASTPSPAPLMQFCFPPPYFVQYDQNLRFPYMHTHRFPQVNQPLGYPIYSFPMGQSGVLFRMPNSQPQGWSHQPREEDIKMKETWMSKIARDKRKQARQRSRTSASGAPSIPEETRGQPVSSGESNVQVTVTQNRNPYVFCAPDGKKLKEILTKKLKNSDVGSLGRIVLPKREAEVKLPALRDKEGIDVLLKDVYSDLRWSLKFKYWSNNKSRMYVLENTGDFVNHYELQMGDSVTLYEDEFKNLYVSTKKEQNPELAEPSSSKEGQQPHGTYNYIYMHTPYTHQAKDEEEEASLALLIEELSHREQEEAANSLLSLCSGGGSSSRIQYDKTTQDSLPNSITDEGASSQVADQATIEAAASSSRGQTIHIDYDQQNSFNYVYGGLDTSEVGCNYLLFDHLKDDKT